MDESRPMIADPSSASDWPAATKKRAEIFILDKCGKRGRAGPTEKLPARPIYHPGVVTYHIGGECDLLIKMTMQLHENRMRAWLISVEAKESFRGISLTGTCREALWMPIV